MPSILEQLRSQDPGLSAYDDEQIADFLSRTRPEYQGVEFDEVVRDIVTDYEAPTDWGSALSGGADSALSRAGSTLDAYTGDNQEIVAAAGIDPTQTRQQKLFNRQVGAVSDDLGFWDTAAGLFNAVVDNPTGAWHEVLAQLPNMAPTAIGAVGGLKAGAALGSVAGPAGTLIGGAGGMLIGSFLGTNLIETGSSVQDKARDGVLTDAERYQGMQEGAIKSGVITGVEGLTMGLGRYLGGAPKRLADAAVTKVLKDQGVDVTNANLVKQALSNPQTLKQAADAFEMGLKTATGIKPTVARGAANFILESGGEGFGEYAGTYAATGEASLKEAMLEGLMSMPQSAVDMAISRVGLSDPEVQLQQMRAQQQVLERATPAREIPTTQPVVDQLNQAAAQSIQSQSTLEDAQREAAKWLEAKPVTTPTRDRWMQHRAQIKDAQTAMARVQGNVQARQRSRAADPAFQFDQPVTEPSLEQINQQRIDYQFSTNPQVANEQSQRPQAQSRAQTQTYGNPPLGGQVAPTAGATPPPLTGTVASGTQQGIVTESPNATDTGPGRGGRPDRGLAAGAAGGGRGGSVAPAGGGLAGAPALPGATGSSQPATRDGVPGPVPAQPGRGGQPTTAPAPASAAVEPVGDGRGADVGAVTGAQPNVQQQPQVQTEAPAQGQPAQAEGVADNGFITAVRNPGSDKVFFEGVYYPTKDGKQSGKATKKQFVSREEAETFLDSAGVKNYGEFQEVRTGSSSANFGSSDKLKITQSNSGEIHLFRERDTRPVKFSRVSDLVEYLDRNYFDFPGNKGTLLSGLDDSKINLTGLSFDALKEELTKVGGKYKVGMPKEQILAEIQQKPPKQPEAEGGRVAPSVAPAATEATTTQETTDTPINSPSKKDQRKLKSLKLERVSAKGTVEITAADLLSLADEKLDKVADMLRKCGG